MIIKADSDEDGMLTAEDFYNVLTSMNGGQYEWMKKIKIDCMFDLCFNTTIYLYIFFYTSIFFTYSIII